jgi:hypothetical protein
MFAPARNHIINFLVRSPLKWETRSVNPDNTAERFFAAGMVILLVSSFRKVLVSALSACAFDLNLGRGFVVAALDAAFHAELGTNESPGTPVDCSWPALHQPLRTGGV